MVHIYGLLGTTTVGIRTPLSGFFPFFSPGKIKQVPTLFLCFQELEGEDGGFRKQRCHL